jgi:hypothetical protein
VSSEDKLSSMIAKFTPEIAAQAVEARKIVRELLPGAVEMVYDNYNALVIGFGPTEKTSQVVLSLALYPKWIRLFFAQGVALPDPTGRLEGDGTQVRSVLLEDATTLDQRDVRALIAKAVARSRPPIDASQPGRMVIKSISAKQRPRRPATKPK